MSENIIAKLNEEPKTIWIRLITVAIVVSLMTWGSQSLHFTGFTDSGYPILTLTDNCDCGTWYDHRCNSCDSC